MNSSNTIRRRIAVGVFTAIVFSTFAACGTEVAPTQDISGTKVHKSDAPPVPARTSVNRRIFDDEFGQAKAREHKASPAGSGTRNRMDFRDDGR